jgi:hypothetical protein
VEEQSASAEDGGYPNGTDHPVAAAEVGEGGGLEALLPSEAPDNTAAANSADASRPAIAEGSPQVSAPPRPVSGSVLIVGRGTRAHLSSSRLPSQGSSEGGLPGGVLADEVSPKREETLGGGDLSPFQSFGKREEMLIEGSEVNFAELTRESSAGAGRGVGSTLLAPKSSSLLRDSVNLSELPAEGDKEGGKEEGGSSEKDEENEEEDDESESSSSSSESESEVGWRSLRKTCLDSWGAGEKANAFWSNTELSSVVVMAAVGFVEALPGKWLVPPVPAALEKRCLNLSAVIDYEFELMKEVEEKRVRSKEQLMKLADNLNANSLEKTLSYSRSWSAFESQIMLKLRQQYCPPRLQRYGTPLRPITPLNRRSTPLFRDNEPRPQPEEHADFAQFHDESFSVFLTTRHDLLQEDQLFRTSRPNTVTAPRDKVEQQSEMRVSSDRALTSKVHESVFLVKSRRSRRAAVERMRVTPAAIRIQALIRGWLCRKRAERRRHALRLFRATVLIQRAIRRLLAIFRAKRLKLVYRRECYIARRDILKKNKSAFILTKFIRFTAFVVQRTKNALQVSTVDKEVVKEKIRTFKKTAIVAQSLWRGYLTRKVHKLRRESSMIMEDKSDLVSVASSNHSPSVDSAEAKDSPEANLKKQASEKRTLQRQSSKKLPDQSRNNASDSIFDVARSNRSVVKLGSKYSRASSKSLLLNRESSASFTIPEAERESNSKSTLKKSSSGVEVAYQEGPVVTLDAESHVSDAVANGGEPTSPQTSIITPLSAIRVDTGPLRMRAIRPSTLSPSQLMMSLPRNSVQLNQSVYTNISKSTAEHYGAQKQSFSADVAKAKVSLELDSESQFKGALREYFPIK